MLKIFSSLIIFVVVVCISCGEPSFMAAIKNKTNNDVLIKIEYDRDAFEKHWQSKPYIPYLESAVKDGGTLISLDTINLISKIKLKPNDEFIIEGGLGKGPDFELIKKISVFSKEIKILDTKQEMINAFQDGRDYYEFQIIN